MVDLVEALATLRHHSKEIVMRETPKAPMVEADRVLARMILMRCYGPGPTEDEAAQMVADYRTAIIAEERARISKGLDGLFRRELP